MAPLPPLVLAISLTLAAATDLSKLCIHEMNKIKDLLQVSCPGKGLTAVPLGLPRDTGILVLASNQLAQVSAANFTHLPNLTDLDLSKNGLGTLKTDSPLPNLHELDLSYNALQSLPALQGFSNLKRLALGHNAISHLPEGGLWALGQLEDLELQANHLQSLSPGAFQGLANLKDLDLSENELGSLPQDLLAGLEKLETLRLERNQLRSVPDGFFPEGQVFAYVFLAGNPWRCDCQLAYLRAWIIENDFSVYTRVQGPEKEIVESDPESVRCQAPPKEKGHPVMHFQVVCKDPGDSDGWEGNEDPLAATESPSPSPAPSTPTPTTTVPPPPNSPITSTALSTQMPTTTIQPPPTGIPTTPSPTTSVVPTDVSSGTSTVATPKATSKVTSMFTPTAATPAPLLTSTPVPTSGFSTSPMSPTPEVTSSSPKSSSSSSSTTFIAPSTPPAPPSAPLATSPYRPRCLCPALPAAPPSRVTSRPPFLRLPWCLLHLVLFTACLLLVVLPMLSMFCCLGWMSWSWHRPAMGAPLVRYRPLPLPTAKGWQGRGSSEAILLPVPQMYRVSKTIKVAPFRHVSWLLISLPGPAGRWPWQQQGNVSSYSLDRGTEAIGAVRVKYGASTL